MKKSLSRWHTVVSAALLACMVFASGIAFAQEGGVCSLYRGVVTNTLDPLLKGRVQVMIPSLNATALWALPSVPFEKRFVTPAAGQAVWIAFEACHSGFPVWTGGFDARCETTKDGHQRCELNP